MISSNHDETPGTAPAEKRTTLPGILFRALLNVGIIAAGYAIYLFLSLAPEKSKNPPPAAQPIRTQVTELKVGDYPVVVKSHGIVQPHNEITLSAQVAGQVLRISPGFEVGAYFSEGDVLVELDDRDYTTALALAEAQHLSAKAALTLASQNHEQNRTLIGRSAITLGEVNQTTAAYAQAAAELQSMSAQVEQAKRNLERTKIRAPFDGRVRSKMVGLGQTVAANTPLGELFAVEFAEVRLPIAGRECQYLDLPEFPNDPTVAVELRDPLDPSSISWNARIVRTEGVLDENSRELFAIARVDDPFGRKTGKPPLRIGQPVVGSIAGKVLANVVALPRVTVRQLDQICLVNRENLTLSTKTIIPIWSDEKHIIVRDSTIADGTLLSTTHLVYAPNGAKVEIIPNITLPTEEIADRQGDKEIKRQGEKTAS